MEQIQKVRSNVYLDINLKQKAMNMFKEYGLSLSDGINILLEQATETKSLIVDLNLEPVYKDDDDYKAILETRNDELVSLDEFLKS